MSVKIVVLCGGLSPERNVSLSSGGRIALALRSLGHRAALVDMYLGLEDMYGDLEAAFDAPLPDTSRAAESEPDLDAVRAGRRLKGGSLFGEGVLEICAAADVVFLALHGQCGEDGRVQAAFDLMGIRYTGSGYLASALAMDKSLTKALVSAQGVLTPEWRFYGSGEAVQPGSVPLPCVVKPVNSGSSIGVQVVSSSAELSAAVAKAQTLGDGVLIERFIRGREVQMSILGGRALPSIEIRSSAGFYDYRNKYHPGVAEEITPADIPPETEERLARAALTVYNTLGLKSLARADFILDGEDRLWFLEINTLPGMTPTSLAPQEAAAAGLSYEQLCQKIIDLALEEDKT